MAFRVTYATLSADNEELHTAYEAGVATARTMLGQRQACVIDGRDVDHGDGFETRSPIDRDVAIANFATATDADVDAAVMAAVRGFPGWAGLPWRERCDILDRGADVISERRNEVSALLSIEIGKNRLEALGDVEETADLIRYYTHQIREHGGFEQPMGRLAPDERTSDVMRPYGVWAVISPFNFPAALAGGPMGAALAAGNTVVLKPSEQGGLTSLLMARALWDGGVPASALHVVFGPGETVGRSLVGHPEVDGITFTGSYEVGMEIYHRFAGAYPKPAICEMGGKNPVIVSRHADLDLAVEGTTRSAFGLTGQKCSAASRAYVERPVYDEFVAKLVERANAVAVGDPVERASWMGPIIDSAAVERYGAAVEQAHREGRVLCGGRRLTEGALARGNFVAPTVVEVPPESSLWTTELFAPFIAVMPVDSLDDALARANDQTLGLTAGFYSADRAEIDRFLDRIEAGVVYVNRRAGATTGAWPGVQAFGGWKGSGSGGKGGGGPYYVLQYLREQSRTIIEDEG
jgi:1-pyrroline-5-carboxylate dehydrogenase